jgi:NADH-quinone oxidoreductase subunit M
MTNPTPLDPRAVKPLAASSGVMQTQAEPGKPSEIVFPTAGPVSFSIPRLMKNAPVWAEYHEARVKHFTNLAAQADEAANKVSDPAIKPLADERAAKTSADRDRAKNEQSSFRTTQMWLFFLLVAGFAVKVPLIPFHTWLPSAYGEAPTGVVLLFSALMAKLGTLGFLRIVIPLAPDAAVEFGLPVLGFLGAAGIVYAAFCAYAQRDMKLLAAYSSVSHLGLLVLGTFALNKEGMTGAALHMVNHGLSAGAMFALVGFLAERYRTTDSNLFGGLIAKFPVYAFFMMVIALASVGLPGLNNFVSEMMLIAGLFTPWNTHVAGYALASAAAAGIFLSAWYTFTMIRRVFFGPLQLPQVPTETEPKDANLREIVAFAIPAILCLGLGLFPQPVLNTMRADVAVLVGQTDAARARQDKATATRESPPIMRLVSQPNQPIQQPKKP